MSGSRLLYLVLAPGLAVGLAACGGSTRTVTRTVPPPSTSPAQTSTTPASTPATTPTTATTATAPTTAATTTPSGTPACVAADLTLTYLGQQGAAGHGELGFALKNTSHTACHTYGYPGVLFVSSHGSGLPTIPQHTTIDYFGHTRLARLTVQPGDEVSFRLGVTHGAIPGSVCTTAAALQVIAPDDTATLRVTIPQGAYECRDVTVSPLQPGTAAYS